MAKKTVSKSKSAPSKWKSIFTTETSELLPAIRYEEISEPSVMTKDQLNQPRVVEPFRMILAVDRPVNGMSISIDWPLASILEIDSKTTLPPHTFATVNKASTAS